MQCQRLAHACRLGTPDCGAAEARLAPCVVPDALFAVPGFSTSISTSCP
jgi:hypothetical protein